MGYRIRDLNGATLPLTGNELLELEQGGTSRQVRLLDLLPGFDDTLGATLASESGADAVNFKLDMLGTVVRSVGHRLAERVSVKEFGAIGDGTLHPLSEFFSSVESAQFHYPDVPITSLSQSVDRCAILQGDASCYAKGRVLDITRGVYICDNGIDKIGEWQCAGNTVMQPFPIVGDSKDYLRPGQKGNIPGAVLLFVGTGAKTMTTQRVDDLASFTYCLREFRTGSLVRGLTIVLDVNVYDANGNLTQLGQDQSANYDVGHVIDDAAVCRIDDVTVFGYFKKAGTVIRSVLGNDDPDYCVFRGGSTMGRYGLALIGSDSNDGQDSGLSGTQTIGTNIFTLDHHSRGPSTAAAIYANADTWRLIFIDGWTDAVNAKINGFNFKGGSMRTYARHAMEFRQASQINFEGVTFEDSVFAGVANTENKQWLASSLTINVAIDKCRYSGDVGLFNPEFGGVMSGQLSISACPGLGIGNGLLICEKDPSGNGSVNWVKIGGASGGTGDAAIQFGSGSPLTSTNGWSVRRRISQSGALAFMFNGVQQASLTTDGLWTAKRIAYPTPTTLTVASSAITVTQATHIIDATGSPTVTTISGGADNEVIVLRKTGTGTVTIAEGGNIVVPGTSFALTAITDVITLLKVGSNWIALGAPADNA